MALLFAVTFFLKYAFDNNWVGPRGRVGIGCSLGSALYPWSHRLLDRGYKYFSEGIAGLGAAVLYLSLWAGWHYYHIFSQSEAFALMIVVTAATLVVAVGRNSERIAFLALVGGLITPMLVSTGENHEVSLFTYLAILGAGVLAIAWVRDWKSLPPVQFLATLIYFWGWYSDFYQRGSIGHHRLLRDGIFRPVRCVAAGAQSARWRAFRARSRHRAGQFARLPGGVARDAVAGVIAGTLTVAVLALAAAHLAAERMLPEKRWHGTCAWRAILYAGLALTFVDARDSDPPGRQSGSPSPGRCRARC